MTDQDQALSTATKPRTAKALPEIVEARDVPNTRLCSGVSTMMRRLFADHSVRQDSENLSKAGDGALCFIGLTMLAAAVLAFLGVI